MTDIKALSRNIRKQSIFEKLDIPRPGLKLLVDPAEQLGTADGEKLGPNLVKNGDFRDFTMGSVAPTNLKGHWIFNDEAVRQKSHPIGDRYMADGTVIGNGYHRILAASATDFNIGTGDFSLAFSVCVGTIGGGTRKGIFCKSGNSGLSSKGIAVWLTESNALRVNIADGSGTAYYFDTTASGAFTTGDWIRAVISVDRNGVQFLHVNGILKAIQAVTNTADITDNAQDLLIGAAVGGSQTPWTGQYDECAYFNRALSINEAERYSKGHLPPSPVGHWKFDSSITANNVTDKSGNGHTVDPISMTYVSGKTRSITQDWSQGGAIWTGNLVSESSPNASEFTDNGTTWWTATRGTFSHNSGTQDATFTVTDDTGQLRIEKTGIITQGTRVRVSFRAKSAHTTSKMSLNGESAYFADVLEIKNPNLSSSYQEYIFEGYVGSANKLTIIFPDDLVNGQSVTIDSIKCQKIGGVGNHLTPASGFDIANQMTVDAPNFKGGKALTLQGNITTDYFSIPHADAADFIPGTGSFSFALKFKLTGPLPSDAYNYGLIGKGVANNYASAWNLSLRGGSYKGVLLRMGDGTNGQDFLPTADQTAILTDGNFHTLIIVWDKGSNLCKMWLDGTSIASITPTATIGDISTAGGVFYVGRNYYGGFMGQIAEAAYWNKALSESEVKRAYGLANGFYYSDGSGAGTYASIFTNENFTQKMVNGANPFQIISQVISGVNASKLYKIVVEATIQNSKQMYIRANNVSATDVIYTGDGNKRVYESYWKGDKPGSAISTLQLFNWNSSAEITFEKVAVHEVLTEGVSNLVEDFSKGGAQLIDIGWFEPCETARASWGTPVTKEASTEIVYQGTKAIKIVADGAGDGGTTIGYTGPLLSAGKTYCLEAYVYALSGTSVRLGRWNGASYLFGGSAGITVNVSLGKWERIRVYFVEPSGGSDSGQYVYIAANAAQTFYFDAISIYEVSRGTQGIANGNLETGQPAHPYAYKFDGVNDYVDFGNTLNVNKYDVLLFGWVYFLNSGSSWKVLLEKGYEYTIAVNEDTNTIVGNSGTGSAWNGNIASTALTPGWYFATFVIKNTYRALFLNGVISNSDLLANTGNGTLPLRWGSANGANYQNSSLGLTGLYLFDGQNGAPDALPADYENWIRRIYNSTKDRYDPSLPKVSLNKPTALKTWTPDLHKSALRLMIDPYRQQKAGWANARNDKAVIDYSKGGIVTEPGFKEAFTESLSEGYSTLATLTHDGDNRYTVEGVNSSSSGPAFNNIYCPINSVPKAIKIEFKDYADIDPVNFHADRRLILRFKKSDGGYVNYTDWTYQIPGFTHNGTYEGWYGPAVLTAANGTYYYYLREFPPVQWVGLSVSIGGNNSGVSSTKKIYNLSVTNIYNAEIGITNGGLESTAWGAHEAAMVFDGVNDYVTFGDLPLLRTHDFIISCWVNPDIPGNGYKTMISHYVSSHNSFEFRVQSTDLFWWHEFQDTIVTMFTTHNPLPNQQWSLVSVVCKRDALGKLYIAHAEVSGYGVQPVIPGSHNFDFTGGQGLNIGRGYGAAEYFDDMLGILTVYVFDAQNGAPALLPFDYENIIREIYNSSKHLYNAALPDVPMLDITTPEPWTPVLHKEALKLLVDPYRQHLAGQNVAKPNKLITDYSGSVVLGSELVTDGDMETAGISGWVSVGSPTSVAKDTTTFNSGSQSIKVVTTTTQTGITRNVTTVIGKLYQVTQYVKCSNNIYIGVVGSGWDNLLTINTYGKWEKFTYTFKATATNTALRMQTDGSTTNATFWGDDFSVKEISGGNHGIATGSLELTGWQKEWGAIKFDGADDYVNFGDVCDISTNDAIFFWWEKSDGSQNQLTTFGKYDPSALNYFHFRIDNTGGVKTAKIVIVDSSGNGINISTPTLNSFGIWTFHAVVVDYSSFVKHYLNNVSGYSGVPNFLSAIANGSSLAIGSAYGTGVIQPLKDKIGISGIYLFDGQDGALSSLPANYEDILTEIYNSTRAIYGV